MTRYKPVAATGATFTLSLMMISSRAIARAAASTWIALKNRRQVTRLNHLDERTLKDIGLMRSDVTAALSLPFHTDPSLHLVDVSGHGTHGARRMQSVSKSELVRLRDNDALVALSLDLAKA